MPEQLQSIGGMHDVLPERTPAWQAQESTIQNVLEAYGYHEIRLPIVERTELFARSIGKLTDIVEKEMYTFEDRNGDSLTLRPEGTAGCVRAGIEHSLFRHQQHRLWYKGPMFRHERPQKGRYRQFHQIGVETFGFVGPDIDAELILMSARMWRRLGLEDLRLEINSLGSPAARAAYREKLITYFGAHREQLDDDSKRRLDTNPLRILDSKNPAMKPLIDSAPNLLDELDAESREHFHGLRAQLDALGIAYVENPHLVRGLDYYNRTVFEWISEQLGAQGTVCAGGRYDGLVEQLGGQPTHAAGFALGLERLLDLIEPPDAFAGQRRVHAYLAMVSEKAEQRGRRLVEELRDVRPELRIVTNCGGGSFKAQLKRADRSGAQFALILGEEEVVADTITIKPLRVDQGQRTVAQAELVSFLDTALANE